MQTIRQPWFSRVERLVIIATTLTVVSLAGGIALDRAGASSLFAAPLASYTSSTNPIILGDPVVASTLTAVAGVWAPAPEQFTYLWYASNEPLDGANNPTYTVTPADSGKKITVTVTATSAGYADLPQSSRPTATVVDGTFSVTANPTISGTAAVGSTLTAVTDGWSPAPSSFSYKWFSNGAPVQDGAEPTYVVTSNDVGRKITLTVTAFLDGYTPVPKSSGALPTVPAPSN